jgi:hypothetical protein
MISIELSKRFKKIVREAGREQEVSSTLRHIPPLIAARHHIHGKRPRHTRCVSCVPSAVIPHPIQPPVNPDYYFPGLTL